MSIKSIFINKDKYINKSKVNYGDFSADSADKSCFSDVV